MKFIKHCRRIALIVGLLAFGLSTAGAQTPKGNWYIGGGLGVSKVKDLCSNGSPYDCDDKGGAYRLFGGLQLNRYFALEASVDVNGDYQSPGATAAGFDGSTAAVLFGLNAIGSIPLGRQVSLYGGVSGSFSYVSTDVTETRYHDGTYTTCYYDGYNSYDGWYSYCTSRRYNDRKYRSDTAVVGGALVGIDVKVARRFHVRAQAQRYFDVDSNLAFDGKRDIDQFTLNALFTF